MFVIFCTDAEQSIHYFGCKVQGKFEIWNLTKSILLSELMSSTQGNLRKYFLK